MNGLREVLCVAGLTAILAVGGCMGGDARVEMTAADAISAVASQLETTVREYHDEVSVGDDARESAVAGAFAARVVSANGDADQIKRDTDAFMASLQKIRKDREVEWDRRNAALDNVAALREMSKGLRKLAIDSLTLQDEVRRYLTSWVDTAQQAKAEADAQSQQRRAERRATRDALIQQGIGIVTDAISKNQVPAK